MNAIDANHEDGHQHGKPHGAGSVVRRSDTFEFAIAFVYNVRSALHSTSHTNQKVVGLKINDGFYWIFLLQQIDKEKAVYYYISLIMEQSSKFPKMSKRAVKTWKTTYTTFAHAPCVDFTQKRHNL